MTDNSISFFDCLVEQKNGTFITSVFDKATFTGLYTSWDSFVPRTRKINLVKTLVHRALMICSSCTLQQELNKIHSILINNGFPANIVYHTIEHDMSPKFGPSLCSICLKLSWQKI